MTIRTATAVIDISALANNLAAIKKIAANSQVLAVLKANAYGHGLVRIAKALSQQTNNDQNADAFGVARLDEALELRAAGVTTPIVLLEGFFSANDLPVLAQHNLQTIIHNHQQLDAIQTADLSQPLTVWLKVDTGMHRLGINPSEFDDFYQQLRLSKNVAANIRLMSHLACADEANNDHTQAQIALFEQLTTQHQEQKSLANSAGICSWPQSHYQWVRPGLILYGVSPMISQASAPVDIQPVMNLQSSVIAIRQIKAGDTVGYGAAWVAKCDTNIAVIAIGYGDGYPRHAPNGTPVLLNGRRVPLVGRVSMDMITVDLGQNPSDNIGDIATLWGQGLPVEEVAQHATTIPYELLCNITRRVQIEVAQ